MQEPETGSKQMKDMLSGLIGDGKREALKKFKEDKKNMFKGIGRMELPEDGRDTFMKHLDNKKDESAFPINSKVRWNMQGQ